jgi:hypothetical protein
MSLGTPTETPNNFSENTVADHDSGKGLFIKENDIDIV